MKKLIALAGALALLAGAGGFAYTRAHADDCCSPEALATCSPTGTCRACTTCSSCKNCSKLGGSCSVCKKK